jgi:hypothetical protein
MLSRHLFLSAGRAFGNVPGYYQASREARDWRAVGWKRTGLLSDVARGAGLAFFNSRVRAKDLIALSKRHACRANARSLTPTQLLCPFTRTGGA